MRRFPGIQIIDSHLHIWELGDDRYSWLKPEHGFLFQDFKVEAAQIKLSAAGISKAILVQADDTLADNNYLLEAADKNNWIAGVVGWMPLEEPKKVEQYLSSLATNSKLVGCRQLIHDDPRNGLVSSELFIESLGLIAAAGFAFDVPDAWPKNLGAVPQLAKEIPELRIVLDHLGKPPRESVDYLAWRDEFAETAQYANVSVKLSGLVNAASDYSAEGLAKIFNEALENFGASRILYGGDWPVSNIDGQYDEMASVLFDLIATLSKDEQILIFSENAKLLYRLEQVKKN